MIRCTVRGCGEPLKLDARAATCPRSHHFDRAKAGYWNLLQPQDRRSLEAGDRKEVAAARRRLFETGFFAPLTAALVDALLARAEASEPTLLDVGCGEGSHLAALCATWPAVQGIGIDLSAPGLELAARRYPDLTWLVANADRGLPLLDASLDVALSITARRPVAEFVRVLRPGGLLILVVPAPDDLVELRQAVLGDDDARDRFPTLLAELDTVPGAFELRDRTTVRHRSPVDHQGLLDLGATTYRAGRLAREERLAALPAAGLAVTGAWEIAVFARR